LEGGAAGGQDGGGGARLLTRVLRSRSFPPAQRNGLHYVYVSSAGAYKANSIEPMHVEGDERKSSAGGARRA
jgi:hypothetical protein